MKERPSSTKKGRIILSWILSLILVLTSTPWDMIARAEKGGETYEEYAERIGLNVEGPEFEVETEDALAPIGVTEMTEEILPVFRKLNLSQLLIKM